MVALIFLLQRQARIEAFVGAVKASASWRNAGLILARIFIWMAACGLMIR